MSVSDISPAIAAHQERFTGITADAAPVAADAPAEAEGLEVPKGSVQDVLDWAGDDPLRVEAALAAENASSKPRKGVIDGLS